MGSRNHGEVRLLERAPGRKGRHGENLTLVLAHRGAAAAHRQNTLEAFAAARASGADGVELDVRRSADGVLVCLHDADLERTTDAEGPVGRRTVAELREVDAGSRFERDQESI